MNKKTVITKISARTGVSKTTISKVLDGLYDTLIAELQRGQKITFAGFGTFLTKQHKPRKYVSFQTGETFVVPPKLVPSVKFSPIFTQKF